MEAHIPDARKRYLYQARKQPTFLVGTYTKSAHEKDTRYLQELRLGAVLKLEWVGIPQLLLQIPNPEACSFMANRQLFIPLRARATSCSNRPSTGQARWPWCGIPMLCLQVKALRARDRLCLAKKPLSPFACFSSKLRAASPSTATRCKRANDGRTRVSSMRV